MPQRLTDTFVKKVEPPEKGQRLHFDDHRDAPWICPARDTPDRRRQGAQSIRSPLLPRRAGRPLHDRRLAHLERGGRTERGQGTATEGRRGHRHRPCPPSAAAGTDGGRLGTALPGGPRRPHSKLGGTSTVPGRRPDASLGNYKAKQITRRHVRDLRVRYETDNRSGRGSESAGLRTGHV